MRGFENALRAFERVDEPPLVAYLRSGDASWLRAAGFLDPDTILPANSVPAGSLERGRAVVLESVGPVSCYVKHYFRGGLAARLLGDRYLSAGRFVRELAAYELLRARNVAVPRVLALLLQMRRPFVRAWLVSECIEHTRGLGTALAAAPPAGRRRLLRSAGTAVRRIHGAGVLHPDLTVENVRIGADGTVFVFDFDRCALTSHVFRRWWNLFRLHRSAVKSGLWRTRPGGPGRGNEQRDVAAFLLGYLGGSVGGRGAKHRLSGSLFAVYRVWERAHAIFWRRRSPAIPR